ncbi:MULTISPECIES: nuclear transport factor 2 family protein [unclassified Chryseobacterium]|uniref:nuclear transport factor 2 family protein n=1 Tax=unclassified Chryseobacterium TaxID=2593645 RepID=UPI00226AB88B|nr:MULTISPECIES: nuclear transport factor 2 family protein [unclassified Chryseobacterium]
MKASVINQNSANETLIRELYRIAEVQDSKGFAELFAEDGYFWDVSSGTKYYGEDIGKPVDIFATAFPDMHRELYELYVLEDENTVIVELSLNGTHNGSLQLASGTLEPTGKTIEVPCCDVFKIENGKVKSFHCYNAGMILLGQLGVF